MEKFSFVCPECKANVYLDEAQAITEIVEYINVAYAVE